MNNLLVFIMLEETSKF